MQKTDFIEHTKSLCPYCKTLLDATISPQDGKVFMNKSCKDHGDFKVLLSSDAQFWVDAKKYNKPGQQVKEFQTEVSEKGCPFDCGLCPEHKQHGCLGIVEITQQCNMECPTCFSSSSPRTQTMLSTQEVERAMDTLVTAEGELDIIQFSGGEPTIHPQILDFVRLAKTKKIKNIMINTNGKRFANDKRFVQELAQINSSDYPIIYLQFDGFKEETYEKIRGEKNLLDTKLKALENLKDQNISVMLVCTLQKGINDAEIGDIIDYVLDNEHITGVVFQPTFFAGRREQQDRITIPDVIDCVVTQTNSKFRKSDFFSIPCCYPGCSTVTYAFTDKETGAFKVLPREIDVSYYLDYFKNSTVPNIEQIAREALEGLYSAGAVPNSDKLLENFCVSCNLPVNIPELKNKVKMILVQPFMDAWNFDVRRAEKCCVMEALPDGKIIPFCVYNTLYRGK